MGPSEAQAHIPLLRRKARWLMKCLRHYQKTTLHFLTPLCLSLQLPCSEGNEVFNQGNKTGLLPFYQARKTGVSQHSKILKNQADLFTIQPHSSNLPAHKEAEPGVLSSGLWLLTACLWVSVFLFVKRRHYPNKPKVCFQFFKTIQPFALKAHQEAQEA